MQVYTAFQSLWSGQDAIAIYLDWSGLNAIATYLDRVNIGSVNVLVVQKIDNFKLKYFVTIAKTCIRLHLVLYATNIIFY